LIVKGVVKLALDRNWLRGPPNKKTVFSDNTLEDPVLRFRNRTIKLKLILLNPDPIT
jgi:hypothetical protein